MSKRIANTFERLKSQGRQALIPYVMAGDPSPASTVAVMDALVRGGADIIELGIPFSDPMADGPVIQKAAERALTHGVSLQDVLGMVSTFRASHPDVPVVLMGYANPVECFGVARFVDAAAQAGVDGVLIVDYPPEAARSFAALLKAREIDLIFLLAPTSTDQRMALVGELASGYVYHVSLRGVTGAGHLDTDAVAAMVPRIRQHVRVPVGVGFGIRDGASARAVAQVADAVVIGTALVQTLIRESGDNVALAAERFIRDIRLAMDQ